LHEPNGKAIVSLAMTAIATDLQSSVEETLAACPQCVSSSQSSLDLSSAPSPGRIDFGSLSSEKWGFSLAPDILLIDWTDVRTYRVVSESLPSSAIFSVLLWAYVLIFLPFGN
jgi:hypothetical protein